MWIFDKEKKTMVNKEISFVPGLYKIVDEILVNAADNKVRPPKCLTMALPHLDLEISITDPEHTLVCNSNVTIVWIP
jgi:DNA topoisomerase-2